MFAFLYFYRFDLGVYEQANQPPVDVILVGYYVAPKVVVWGCSASALRSLFYLFQCSLDCLFSEEVLMSSKQIK